MFLVVTSFLNETFLMPVFNKQYGWTEEEASVVNEGMLTQNTKLFYWSPFSRAYRFKGYCVSSRLRDCPIESLKLLVFFWSSC